jgi:deoxyhypusine synthase
MDSARVMENIMNHKSLFEKSADIIPQPIKKNMSIPQLIHLMEKTSFESRNIYKGATLYQQMIDEKDTIWLGIAGAGIAGGMGGMVISLLEAGFIDVICSTGAQVYHDLHFAFDLPVKAISPHWDDNVLRTHGDTRIYDIGIREKETLEVQDRIICDFIKDEFEKLSRGPLSSWEFNYLLGLWTLDKAKYPERSFVAEAAKQSVPIFWDSLSNHSIAMNLMKMEKAGYPVQISASTDIFDSAAIAYTASETGFVELGGGGPKNFIQQTGPTISQILNVDFEGADRGLQISTAVEREGSLSSCTFDEAVTWGKYKSTDDTRLVQIWSEYSIIFPLISAFVIDECQKRKQKNIITKMDEFRKVLDKNYSSH